MKHLMLAAVSAMALAMAPAAMAESDDLALGVLAGLLESRADDGQRTDEAALIVGALLGLAALERAEREGRREEPPESPATAEDLRLLPSVPSRPAAIEADAAERLGHSAPPSLGPSVPIGTPSLEIPPPPPAADVAVTSSATDVAQAIAEAADGAATGF